MTDAVPWVKWRFDHWRGDEGLRICTLAARGLWVDLLAFMHGGKPYGHLSVNGRAPSHRQIASMVGMTTEKEVTNLLQELENAGVFSRTIDGLIYSRRLVRDNAARVRGRETGLLGGNPSLIHASDHEDNGSGNPPPITGGLNPPRKPRVREEREKRERRGDVLSSNADFETFWTLYPRKDAKGDARKAWAAACRIGVPEDIIAGLRQYPFDPDPKMQKLPAGWLRGERWRCEIDTMPVTLVANGHDSELDAFRREMGLFDAPMELPDGSV